MKRVGVLLAALASLFAFSAAAQQPPNINYAPLYKAAFAGKAKNVQAFIDKNPTADLSTPNANGNTALMMAAESGDPETLKLILPRGGDVNARDKRQNTAIIFPASRYGAKYRAAITTLLDAGADINVQNEKGQTPAIAAATVMDDETILLLATRGADLKLLDKNGGSVRSVWLGEARKRNPGSAVFLPAKLEALFAEHKVPAGAPVAVAAAPAPKIAVGAAPSGPITCKETTYTGVDAQKGAAIKYLLKKDLMKGPDWFCIENIKVTESFPLRGNTVVKYEALLQFPKGYRLDCLKAPPPSDTIASIGYHGSCGPFNMSPFTKPIPVGGKLLYLADDEI